MGYIVQLQRRKRGTAWRVARQSGSSDRYTRLGSLLDGNLEQGDNGPLEGEKGTISRPHALQSCAARLSSRLHARRHVSGSIGSYQSRSGAHAAWHTPIIPGRPFFDLIVLGGWELWAWNVDRYDAM